MLLDEASGELRIEATQSLSEQYRRKPNLKVGQSISGRAVKERRPIIVADVTTDRDYMYRDMAKQEGLCSLLSVPMMVREKAMGVIDSYTSVPHVFTTEEVKLLQAIANQAAIAIEHTALVEKSFEMQEALAVRKLMERAKGYLMRSKKLTEEEAFKLIQRQSMDFRKSMREIAEAALSRRTRPNGLRNSGDRLADQESPWRWRTFSAPCLEIYQGVGFLLRQFLLDVLQFLFLP